MSEAFDYIVVGAGSAGRTLAYRLTEDPTTRVLLVEAGRWDRDPWIHIPLGWGRILQRRLHDWMYFAEPSSSMNGRKIECARGKVVGGSSSINAMAYYHGHRSDCALPPPTFGQPLKRRNLTVKVNALVSGIAMQGARAAGVDYVQRGQKRTARAEREVILSGGSINSPQLLMLSGIGDPADLKRHIIKPLVPLKGVRKGLLDHTSATITFGRKKPGPFLRNMRLDRVGFALARASGACEGAQAYIPRADRRRQGKGPAGCASASGLGIEQRTARDS